MGLVWEGPGGRVQPLLGGPTPSRGKPAGAGGSGWSTSASTGRVGSSAWTTPRTASTGPHRPARRLDTVEAVEGDRALVTTGSGKYYSNGLDLDWLMAGDDTDGFIEEVHRLFGRVLGLLATVNGHAFAGGPCSPAPTTGGHAADRGLVPPEVDLGLARHARVGASPHVRYRRRGALTGRRDGVGTLRRGSPSRRSPRTRCSPGRHAGGGHGGQGPHAPAARSSSTATPSAPAASDPSEGVDGEAEREPAGVHERRPRA